MDFVVVKVNGEILEAKSLEETLESMSQISEPIVVELRRKQSATVHSSSAARQEEETCQNSSSTNFHPMDGSSTTATTTSTSDYICIDDNDDDDDDNDECESELDDYENLELWCGSKEMSTNFITHVTNCKICSEASDLQLSSILDGFPHLEESESDDGEMNNNNNDYDEINYDIKYLESDSALDESTANEMFSHDLDLTYFSSLPIKNDMPVQNLKNVRHNSTDTNITEVSSNQDDSAIGRTDDSLKTDESSEQELLDNYAVLPFCLSKSYHFESSNHLSSSDLSSENNSINKNCINTDIFVSRLTDKLSATSFFSSDTPVRLLRRNRMVPRMGTRLAKNPANETAKDNFIEASEGNSIWLRQSNSDLSSPSLQQKPVNSVYRSENFASVSSSKSSLSDHSKESLRSVIAKQKTSTDSAVAFENCISTYASLQSSVPTSRLLKKCLRSSPQRAKSRGKNVSFNISENQCVPLIDGIDEKNYMHLTNVINGNEIQNVPKEPKDGICDREKVKNQQKNSEDADISSQSCEILKKLYTQHIDVMYTNQANLEHTMMVQQKLFSQQIQLLQRDKKTRQKAEERNKELQEKNGSAVGHFSSNNVGQPAVGEADSHASAVEMRWVMKRRPDGSRYITRRPVKKQRMRKRAERLSEERKDMTTDDDAASEMKAGRYWTREERREQVREKRNRLKVKMETLREHEDSHNHHHHSHPSHHHHHHNQRSEQERKVILKSKIKDNNRIEVPASFIKGHLKSLMAGGTNQLLSVTTV